jgi:hypothetical protein
MNLIPNAAEVAAKSWTVRLALLTATLAAIVTALPSLPAEVQALPYFATVAHWLTVASGIATAIARVIQQPNLTPPSA